jgi:effector-binding domain-containing protein
MAEEGSEMIMVYEIDDRVLDEQVTAVVRGEMPAAELPGWLAGVYRDVQSYLRRVGVDPAGPPFARYTFFRDVVAVEAGFPVTRLVGGEGLIVASRLPGGHAAVTTHAGAYEDLDKAYHAVEAWLEAHDRVGAGPHWEVYHTDPAAQPDPAAWRTDVVAPYRTA